MSNLSNLSIYLGATCGKPPNGVFPQVDLPPQLENLGNDVCHCRSGTRAVRDECVAERNRSVEYICGFTQRAFACAKDSYDNNRNSGNGSHSNNAVKQAGVGEKAAVSSGRRSAPASALPPPPAPPPRPQQQQQLKAQP